MQENKHIKVLVAEDDFLVAREIVQGLEAAGYQNIDVASNGEKAIEMARSLDPDVVLMDIKMPKMDGLEATHQIQKRCPTSVIILTAHETEEYIDMAGEIGASAYLTKPPNPSEIDRAMTIAMARHEDLMELHRLNKEITDKNREIERAFAEINALRGILPICAN